MADLLGGVPGIVVGVGVGAAASAALEPAVEIPKQEAWAANANKILSADLIARLVATGAIDLSTGQADVRRDGYGADKLDALVYLAQTTPTIAQVLELWRRFKLPDELWSHALIKAGIDARYYPFLNDLKTGELLGLGDVAMAVVRGILPAPAWVPVAPPAHGDKVPRFPVVNIDPAQLAEKLGFTEEMLQIMVGRSGLSMAPIMAANALFRGVIGPNDYLLAIAEGDLRTEWAEAVRDTARQILTAGEYTELELRGWYDRTTRLANTAKHGMSDEDSDLLFKVLGRPMAARQVFQAERRGGKYDGPLDVIEPAFLKSLRESNIRPEWYNLEWAYRFSQPSVFVIRQYLKDGGDPAWARTKLEYLGWEASDIDVFVATYSGGGTATTSDPHVAKAQTQLWTTTHRSYVAGETDDADASAALEAAGVAAAAVPAVLTLWRHERTIIRKQLTPTQLRKAWSGNVVNPSTGTAWTRDEALARLEAMGYSAADAVTFLEEA